MHWGVIDNQKYTDDMMNISEAPEKQVKDHPFLDGNMADGFIKEASGDPCGCTERVLHGYLVELLPLDFLVLPQSKVVNLSKCVKLLFGVHLISLIRLIIVLLRALRCLNLLDLFLKNLRRTLLFLSTLGLLWEEVVAIHTWKPL